MRLRFPIAAAAAMVALAPTFAQAQSGSSFAAAAFDEGRRLFGEGQIAAACKKFQASLDLDPQRNTLQALAVCREKEEKWASAWDKYIELAQQASKAGEEDKARLARTKATELEKKLLYVVLVMDQPPADVAMSLDGTKVDASLLGTKLPVDPGPHDVLVTAPGKKPWKQRITVGPSPVEQQVKIAKLEDAPASEQNGSGTQYQLPGPMRPAPSFWTTQRTIGVIVGGVGLAALGTAVAFQFVAFGEGKKRDDLNDKIEAFNERRVPITNAKGEPIGVEDAVRARDSNQDAIDQNQAIAIVMASAGGAMVVTGIVLIATGGHRSPSASWKPKGSSPLFADFSLTPVASPRSFGLVGTF